MEEIGKLLDHLGYATPLLYAGAAYRLFAWLDENASDKAKAALATATKLRALPNEQVATALVEIFDRIFTSPLLHWRAALVANWDAITVPRRKPLKTLHPLQHCRGGARLATPRSFE